MVVCGSLFDQNKKKQTNLSWSPSTLLITNVALVDKFNIAIVTIVLLG